MAPLASCCVCGERRMEIFNGERGTENRSHFHETLSKKHSKTFIAIWRFWKLDFSSILSQDGRRQKWQICFNLFGRSRASGQPYQRLPQDQDSKGKEPKLSKFKSRKFCNHWTNCIIQMTIFSGFRDRWKRSCARQTSQKLWCGVHVQFCTWQRCYTYNTVRNEALAFLCWKILQNGAQNLPIFA